MGAFCSRAVSPLWTYFQSRVIIAGTAPQDENLIPNRICLDSWISPHWDLLQKTAGPLLDPHHGKLCCLLPLVNLQPLLSKFKILSKNGHQLRFIVLILIIYKLYLPVCVRACVCVCVGSEGHQPLEGAPVVWNSLTCQFFTPSMTLTTTHAHTHTHTQYSTLYVHTAVGKYQWT